MQLTTLTAFLLVTGICAKQVNLHDGWCGEKRGYFKDPADCAYYYVCTDTISTRMPCGPGTWFNELILACDFPSHVNCTAASLSSPAVTSSASSPSRPTVRASPPSTHLPTTRRIIRSTLASTLKSTTVPTTVPTTKPTTSRPTTRHITRRSTAHSTVVLNEHSTIGVGSFLCPVNATGRLFPDRDDCSYFYNCVGRVGVRMVCSSGLYFNPATSRCDYPANVACTAGQHLRTTTQSPRPSSTAATHHTSPVTVQGATFVCPSPDGLFPDPRDCGKFYQCASRVSYHFVCYPGLHFNPSTKRCDYPAQAHCSSTTTPHIVTGFICPSHVHAFYPDTTNCGAFYECEAGIAYHKMCTPPLYFNPAIISCDYPHNVNCKH